MSGPFGVSINLISERAPGGGEIVVAAATFLEMNWLSTKLFASHSSCRPAFISACHNFAKENQLYKDPNKYISQVSKPSNDFGRFGHFWLAFDKEGEELARRIVDAAGKTPDKAFYKNVNIVTLFEHQLPDPPDKDLIPWLKSLYDQLDPWRKTIKKIQSDYS